MTSTWGHIIKTTENRSALPAWLLTFVISLLPIYFVPELTVSALWVAPAALVMLFVTWILFRSVTDALVLANEDRLPAVLSVHSERGEGCVLLLSASRLFGQGVHVSIYFENESGFEVRIGHGLVRNIQDNGFIQVEVREWEQAYSTIADRIIAAEKEACKRVAVKPAVQVDSKRDANNLNSLMIELLSREAWASRSIKELPEGE